MRKETRAFLRRLESWIDRRTQTEQQEILGVLKTAISGWETAQARDLASMWRALARRWQDRADKGQKAANRA